MHDVPVLDKKGLRKFGFTTGAIIVILFGLLLPWLRDRPLPWWPFSIAAILCIWALVAPTSLNLVYQPWMKVGLVLGWINTRIILAIIFFVLLTPLGWLQRKRGKLGYKTGFESNTQSYKITRTQRLTAKDLENPF